MNFEEGKKFWREQLEPLLAKTDFTVIESLDDNFTESEVESLLYNLPRKAGQTSIREDVAHPKFLVIRERFSLAEIRKILPNKKFRLRVFKGHKNPGLPFPYENS